MAKESKGPPPSNVIQLPSACPVSECRQKPRRAGFCEEHFDWFKEGLVTRKGERPKDFDKKYQAWSVRKKAA